MSDLIDKQVVLDIIHLFFTEEVDKIPTKKTEDGELLVIRKCQPLFEMNKAICKRIKALPSVTAEPKAGHWEQYGNSWEDKFKCSECGKEQPKILFRERIIGHWSDYCPNCGAKMIESEVNA